jgi:hypothetical protein
LINCDEIDNTIEFSPIDIPQFWGDLTAVQYNRAKQWKILTL